MLYLGSMILLLGVHSRLGVQSDKHGMLNSKYQVLLVSENWCTCYILFTTP